MEWLYTIVWGKRRPVGGYGDATVRLQVNAKEAPRIQSGLLQYCFHLWKRGDNERSEIDIEKGARTQEIWPVPAHTPCALLANARWETGEKHLRHKAGIKQYL